MGASAVELGRLQVRESLDDGGMFGIRSDGANYRLVDHAVGRAGAAQVSFDPPMKVVWARRMLQNKFDPVKDGYVIAHVKD